MKAVKIVLIAAVVYAAIVVAFESMVGFMQPTPGGTIMLTTFDANGAAHDRIVSRLDSVDQMYVSANHWPRAWYKRVLANPDVQVTIDGAKIDYRAVPVDEAQAALLDAEHPHPAWFRFATGYPPRKFVRLEPR
jgi:hypothetical protein